jgi:hypothetical protein
VDDLLGGVPIYKLYMTGVLLGEALERASQRRARQIIRDHVMFKAQCASSEISMLRNF